MAVLRQWGQTLTLTTLPASPDRACDSRVDGVVAASYGDQQHPEAYVTDNAHHPSRRHFLRAATAAGAAAFVGLRSARVAAEPPPETTTLKILQFPSGCQGPVHAAEELLRGEGFTDVRYVPSSNTQDMLKMLDTRA